MTETELREQFVETARSYHGAVQGSPEHQEILALYNGHKPLARGYRMKTGDAWCAAFVSAVAIQCGLTEIIPTECSCGKMMELHKQQGSWYEGDGLEPEAGDLILYDWQDSGEGDCTGHPDHIGIVVRATKGVIRVIEGNIDRKVGYREIPVNGRCIRGYCCPDFAGMAEDRKGFRDVAENAWYAEAVRYCAEHGLMTGKDTDLFAPEETATRAELAAVAMRLHQSIAG